jgi:hypothetical protein
MRNKKRKEKKEIKKERKKAKGKKPSGSIQGYEFPLQLRNY